MPMNSLANSVCNSSISFSLVKPVGHSSNGLSGTKNSALKKPAASLPLSGRPCCDTTVMTSGWRSRISRILLTIGMPASSDMVGGIEARIHRLPSSSVGRNSLPSRDPRKPDDDEKDQPDRDRELALGQRPVQHRRVDARACRARRWSRPRSTCSGSSSEAQARRDREGREQRADQRIGVGARHRAEDLALDALHGEQRNEGRDDDRGGEEHRAVDLQGADQDQAQPVGPARQARRSLRARSDRGPTCPRPAACSSACRSSGGAWKFR